MKCLLVRPVSRKMPIVIPNLGLGYLASSLRRAGHEAEILDCVKEGFGYRKFRAYIEKERPDAVGIQLFTCDYGSVRKMLSVVRDALPHAMTLVGGPHVSGLPVHTLMDMPGADFGFVGEAEPGLAALLGGVRQDRVPGLVFRDKAEIKVNPGAVIHDLDTLGLPAWDLMVPADYPAAPHGTFARNLPTAPIITTRGCPFDCAYCAVKVNTGNRLRMRSMDEVIREIDLLRNKYGVREIHIEDDNFTLHRGHVEAFCEALLAKPWNITWACPNGLKIETLDAPLLRLMERSGCVSFAIGIESGSERIHKAMGRHVGLARIRERVELVRKVTNIRMTGFFMMGYPGETLEDLRLTDELARSLPLDRAQFSNFLPLPGTRIFEDLVRAGAVSPDSMDWNGYLDNRIVYAPEGMSPKALRRAMKRAFWGFYMRPRIAWGLLGEIRSPGQALVVLKRTLDIFS